MNMKNLSHFFEMFFVVVAGRLIDKYIFGSKNRPKKSKNSTKNFTWIASYCDRSEIVNIEKISPQEFLVLKQRKESLVPLCRNFFLELNNPLNRANLAGLNLQNILNHLENRYLDLALCVAPLLNSTFSPLHEALQGCNMLPRLA